MLETDISPYLDAGPIRIQIIEDSDMNKVRTIEPVCEIVIPAMASREFGCL